jgi:uncharacterized protein YqfA (UPF0365 family)
LLLVGMIILLLSYGVFIVIFRFVSALMWIIVLSFSYKLYGA